jgi:hypothetical protein
MSESVVLYESESYQIHVKREVDPTRWDTFRTDLLSTEEEARTVVRNQIQGSPFYVAWRICYDEAKRTLIHSGGQDE